MLFIDGATLKSSALHQIFSFASRHLEESPIVFILTGHYDSETKIVVTGAYKANLTPTFERINMTQQSLLPINVLKWHQDCNPNDKVIGYMVMWEGVHEEENPFVYTTYFQSLINFLQ